VSPMAGLETQPAPVRSPAPPYPSELECEVITRDGGSVHLRPIRPEDAAALVTFHRGLSRRSVYRRYFFMHTELSADEVTQFTCVDYVDRVALVVLDGEQLIGIGRYNRTPGTTEAEVAFVVADAYQHRGLATHLLERLADAAWSHGITTFVALVLVENRDMLDVFMHAGYPVDTDLEGGTLDLRFSIAPTAATRSARRSHRSSPLGC
jgi:GNAT superfamily N-acetyltransferase